MTREDIVTEAREWIDTPFVPGQAVKGHGCDCAGLVIGIAKSLGIVPPDFSVGPYSQQPHGFALSAVCRKHMRQIKIDDAQPGDVLEMRFATEPQHLAIVTDYPGARLAVVHALTLSKKVVEHRLDAAWRRRITAAYSLV